MNHPLVAPAFSCLVGLFGLLFPPAELLGLPNSGAQHLESLATVTRFASTLLLLAGVGALVIQVIAAAQRRALKSALRTLAAAHVDATSGDNTPLREQPAPPRVTHRETPSAKKGGAPWTEKKWLN